MPCSSLTVIPDAFICCINLESGTITCGAVATKIQRKKKTHLQTRNHEDTSVSHVMKYEIIFYFFHAFVISSTLKYSKPFPISEVFTFFYGNQQLGYIHFILKNITMTIPRPGMIVHTFNSKTKETDR